MAMNAKRQFNDRFHRRHQTVARRRPQRTDGVCDVNIISPMLLTLSKKALKHFWIGPGRIFCRKPDNESVFLCIFER